MPAPTNPVAEATFVFDDAFGQQAVDEFTTASSLVLKRHKVWPHSWVVVPAGAGFLVRLQFPNDNSSILVVRSLSKQVKRMFK